ncbi:MAG: hypothetical protein K0S08_1557 [Gammaproteobacteria bacterium]|jgi:ankyrin repeat protein|nr:hypothetical protein [Gammaproteobacteria bacterium]
MPKNEITLEQLKTTSDLLNRTLIIATKLTPYLSEDRSIQSLFDNKTKEVRASLTPSEILFLVKNIAQRDIFATEKYNGLHYSVRTAHQYKELIDAFMPYADVNLVDENGDTPILFLAGWQRLDAMRCFIKSAKQYKKDINFNAKTLFNQTTLILACSLRDTEMAKYLIDLKLTGEASLDVNVRDRDGRTALHYACLLGDIETATLLVQAGAKILIEDNWGDTPLKLAYFSKNKLENHLEDMNIIPWRDEKAKQDYFCGNTDAALRLVTPRKTTLCEIVANKKNLPLLLKTLKENYILNHRKYIETKEEEALNDEEKQVLLKQAEIFTGKSILNAALEGQIKIRQAFTTKELEAVFQQEVSHGQASKVETMLKESPAILSTTDIQTKQTALHLAAIANNVETAKILLSNHVPIDSQDIHGNTALHLACQKTSYLIIEALLYAGANTTLRNSEGKTAWQVLHCAEKFPLSSETALKIHQLFVEKLCITRDDIDEKPPSRRYKKPCRNHAQ